MQIGTKIDEIGGNARIAYVTILFFLISIFLDVANASSMPQLLKI